jgi:predicted CopG family antitoxin
VRGKTITIDAEAYELLSRCKISEDALDAIEAQVKASETDLAF